MKPMTLRFRRIYKKTLDHREVPMRPFRIIVRACLGCEQEFETDQKDIRMCETCKGSEAWRAQN